MKEKSNVKTIKINGQNIDQKTQVKYLGRTPDNKFLWSNGAGA